MLSACVCVCVCVCMQAVSKAVQVDPNSARFAEMEKALAKACGANDESISLEALLASVNKSIKPQVRRAEMCALLQHMHELNRIYFDASSDTVMPI